MMPAIPTHGSVMGTDGEADCKNNVSERLSYTWGSVILIII